MEKQVATNEQINENIYSHPNVNLEGDTVTRIRTTRGEIIILGTAHVSEDSAREVEESILRERPGKVCVELDANRVRTLQQDSGWQNLDIFQIIRERKTFLLLSSLVLSAYQKRLGLDLGTRPGEEMRTALRCAEEQNIKTATIDRDIQITLTRAWRKSGFWGRNKILAVLLGSAFSREKISEEDLEKLKKRSALDEMMSEMAEFLPSVKAVLIDERDHFLAIRCWQEAAEMPGDGSILAVAGAGHVPGMVKKILELDSVEEENPSLQLENISSVPPRGMLGKIFPWTIVLLVAGLIGWGFISRGWEGGLQALLRWILVNGTLSAVGAAVALAHPLTIISSFLAAPITSMNPTIGVGFVTGLLEAFLRKPRVEDFEKLGDDSTSFKGVFRNRITRILLVFFFSSLGSAIGTFIAIPLLFPGVG